MARHEKHNPKSRLKPPPDKPSCATCGHVFEIAQSETPTGFCRRYPPALKIDGVTGAFPPVRLDWKCGEWRKPG